VHHHEHGRLREAEAIYKDALAAAPDHPALLHLAGLVAYQLGRTADAVLHLERAVAGDRMVAAYHDNLGLALRAVGRVDEAAAAHRQAAVLDRSTPGPKFNLGAALQSLGRHDDAIAAFRRALAIAPDYPEVHNAMAVSLAQSGKLDLAASHARRALATRPGYADAHLTLANILATEGQSAEAIAHYGEALRVDPTHGEARRGLAIAQLQAGDLDNAAATVAPALNEGGADMLYIGAEIARRQGRLADAEALFRRSAAAEPRGLEPRRSLAANLRARGETAEARRAYDAILAAHPGHEEATRRLAEMDKPI
jgi:tetratricopeptide (TPR) repeat protein